jgi:predicted transcriptional regulator
MSDTDITAKYHRGNSESIKAKELSLTNANRDRQRIIGLAQARGDAGITCDEAERLLGLSHQTCSARFSELKRDGILMATDQTRKTRSNASARVMVFHA